MLGGTLMEHGGEFIFAGMMAMFAGLGIMMFIIAAIAIVFYVLMSIGLMKMADNLELENTWLAWIPVARLYILGKIVGDIEIFDTTIPYTEWILVGMVFVNVVPFIGQFLCFIGVVYFYIVLYHLYKMYSDGQEVLFTILTIVLQIPSIFIFMLRNNERKEIVKVQ